ncbi:hypothetical protein QW180_22915 [Vibrio sinaloensis]|nr:hypothetical protein [Vibrio sinaloensis]
MWDKFVALSEDGHAVLAKLSPDITVDNNFDTRGLDEALEKVGASNFFT